MLTPFVRNQMYIYIYIYIYILYPTPKRGRGSEKTWEILGNGLNMMLPQVSADEVVWFIETPKGIDPDNLK